jgi:hypothetical protein
MNAQFSGTLTITNNQESATTSSESVTVGFSFQESTSPWTVSVPSLPSDTFSPPLPAGIKDNITVAPGASTSGTYDETNGQMTLTLPVQFSDTDGFISQKTEPVNFTLSTSGSLTMESAGSTQYGQPENAAGLNTITLVGSAPVPTTVGPIGIGLILKGTIPIPGPTPGVPTTVPFIVGLWYNEAVALVNAAGLDPMVTDDVTTRDADWGKVLSQNPAGGTAAMKGSLINFSVGAEPKGGGTVGSKTPRPF